MPTTRRINTWSSPRNVSTALMYAFAQRKDTAVFDEPLYAHYLSTSGRRVLHPGADEIIASQEREGEKVIQQLLLSSHDAPIAYFKQMAHHLTGGLNEGFLLEMDNVLLIRDPRAIIYSYSKIIPDPSIEDIGIRKMFHLFQWLQKEGRLAAVVDSRELLSSPPSVLRQLCQRLSIPFDECMLKWNPGPRPEDGVWARYWYSRVHRSSGFEPYQERSYELPPRLERLAEECRPMYEALYEAAIKASPNQ